jgi:O-methyltransferase
MFTRLLSIDDYERVNGALDVLSDAFGAKLFIGEDLVAMDRAMTFAQDPRFLEAYSLAQPSLEERAIVWRVHTALWAAQRALCVPGDFVDFGVRDGLEAAVIGRYLDFNRIGRSWTLFDNFSSWRFQRHPGAQAPKFDMMPFTSARLAFMNNAKVVQINSLLDVAPPDIGIAYLRIEETDPSVVVGAMARLFPKVQVGGSVLIDGYMAYAAGGEFLDRYIRRLEHPVLELPTGQGLIIKQHGGAIDAGSR